MTPVPSTKSLIPEILATTPPTAEVQVNPKSITVTVSVPALDRDDADVTLTRHSLRLRSKRDPASLHLVIPLPVAVEPERYVLRHSNDVFDVVVERLSH